MCYIREYHRGLYVSLQLSGKLGNYLDNINRQAEEIFLRPANQIAKQELVTESLKAVDQMVWAGRMNHIREQAVDIVNVKLIHA